MSRRICILGFAPSKTEAPYADTSWEIWGVNDVYAHVPRTDATFELHHLQNLGNRRNPNYEKWMTQGCPSGPKPTTPIFMIAPNPAWPTAQAFPFEQVRMYYNQAHGSDYFTSSIAWMLALAVLELTEDVTLPDGRQVRLAKPGCELSMFGVDMAADSEFASQRPAVEYYTGLARGMGLKVFVPSTSDICKSTSVYGVGTTAPLAIKARLKIEEITQQKVQIMQQQQAIQAQAMQLQYQLGTADGAKDTWKYIERAWTQPTDIETGATLPVAEHHKLPAAAGSPTEDGAITNGHPVMTGVS